MGEAMPKEALRVFSDGITVEYKNDFSLDMNAELSFCSEGYELFYVTAGCGRLVIESSEYAISSGCAVLIKPLAYYSITPENGVGLERYSVGFSAEAISGEPLKMLLELLEEKDSSVGLYYPDCTYLERFPDIFSRAFGVELLPERARCAYLSLIASELIIHLSLCLGERVTNTEGDLVSRLMLHISRNLKRDLSLDKLSKHFFVSKFYLCRAFKQRVGISLHEYIAKKRIMLAKQLMASGETASDAAYKVGFGDYSSFYRAYVRIVGETPTTRKRIKG